MSAITTGRGLRWPAGMCFVFSVLSVPVLGVAGESFAATVETAQSSATAPVVTTVPEENYPRTLLGDDLVAHFARHPRVEANSKSTPFTLSISHGKAKRYCPGCRLTQDIGKVHLKSSEGLICIDWEKATYPASGCFNLVQTNSSSYDLRTPAGQTVISYAVSAPSVAADAGGKPSPLPSTGDGLLRSIIFNVSAYRASNQVLMDAGQQALRQRGWIIDPCEKECLRGRLEKGGVLHRAEMRFHSPYIEIGFVAGFEEGKAGWLENLKKDILAALNSPRAAR